MVAFSDHVFVNTEGNQAISLNVIEDARKKVKAKN